MRLIALLLATVVFALCAYAYFVLPSGPWIVEPVVEVKPEPKQSPYVLYVVICERLESVIVMSDPPVWIDHDTEAVDAVVEAMIDAEHTGRQMTFTNDPRFCPAQIPQRPQDRI